MSSVIIEFLKLRRSASWGVVLVLPTVSVLCACVLVRPADWQLLWVRSIGFYGMVLLPVSLSVLASLVWRVEHQGSNGLVLMSIPVPTWRTVAAKATAAWLLAAVMQLVLVMAATAVGSLVLGLPGVLPSRYLVAGLLIAVACAPVCRVRRPVGPGSVYSLLCRAGGDRPGADGSGDDGAAGAHSGSLAPAARPGHPHDADRRHQRWCCPCLRRTGPHLDERCRHGRYQHGPERRRRAGHLRDA